jgi:hypothetical protein
MIVVTVPPTPPQVTPAPPPRPGANTRITSNALGFALSTPTVGQVFNHPFRPTLASGSITFRLGTVQSLAGSAIIEPKIKIDGQLVPMSGKNGNTFTPLDLGGVKPNSDSVSWAALEVHPDDATGELNKDSKVEIIHTLSPISHVRTYGRCALAMIVWSGRVPTRVFAMIHFNLRYLRILPNAGTPVGVTKHLFL